MIDKFKNIAPVLQKQILIRLAGSGLGLAMILMMLAYRGSWQLLIPGIIITMGFLISAGVLYDKCVKSNYVALSGICQDIERTSLRKKIKAIYIKSENKTIKIVSQVQRIRNLSVGDKLTVYLPLNEPVYDHDGCFVIFHVIAIGKEW